MQRSSLQGESIVATWGAFTLSTHRVWVLRENNAGFTSMPIDAIECVSIDTVHYPLLVVLAILFIGGGLLSAGGNGNSGASVLGVGLGLVLIVAYVLSRTIALKIHAGAAVMACTIKGSGTGVAQATQFLDAVERQVLAARGADQHIQRNSAPQFSRAG